MIDPKDLEDILARYKGKDYQAHTLKAELRKLLPNTPKQGEVWLTSSPNGEVSPLIYGGDFTFPWIGLSKENPEVSDRYQASYKPISRIYPPEEVDPTPAILSTEDDYDNANPGTVVKDTSSRATPTYEKGWNGTWNVTGNRYNYLASDMALVARTIIYSPEEETAI